MRDFVKIVESHLLNELQGYRGTDEFKAFQDIIGQHSGKKSRYARGNMLRDFVQFLEEKGFQPLGQGAFGATFMHDKLDYVIKIFRNDPAYLTYVGFILNNKDNQYLPQFRGRFMKLDQDNYVVRMEKLTDLYSSSISDSVLYAASMVSNFGAEEWLRKCEDMLKPVDDGFDHAALAALKKKVRELEDAYYAADDKLSDAIRFNRNLERQKPVGAKPAPVNPDQGNLDLVGGGGVPQRRNPMHDLDALAAIKNQRRIALLDARGECGEMENKAPQKNYREGEMRFCVENPEFLRTIERITELGFRCDFHGGNFMMREDVPVITDPLFDPNSIDGNDDDNNNGTTGT